MDAQALASIRRDADGFTRAMRGLRLLLEALSLEDVEAVVRCLDDVLAPPPDRGTDLFFKGDETVWPLRRQRARLARARTDLLESVRRRRALLADALTTSQVALSLAGSRQTPHHHGRAGTLLAIPDSNTLRFPAWQCDATYREGIVPCLPQVLRALGDRPIIEKATWLTSSKDLLPGTPIEMLTAGAVDEVVRAMETVAAVKMRSSTRRSLSCRSSFTARLSRQRPKARSRWPRPSTPGTSIPCSTDGARASWPTR